MAGTPSRDALAELDKPALIELIVQLVDRIEPLELRLAVALNPHTLPATLQELAGLHELLE